MPVFRFPHDDGSNRSVMETISQPSNDLPNVTKLPDLCRLCLLQGSPLFRVFDTAVNGAPERDPLHVRIQQFFHVEIKEDDTLPTGICRQCLQQTETCTEFRESCVRNDRKLRLMLAADAVDQPESTKQTNHGCLSDADDLDDDGDEEPETVVIDPTKNYDSSNQSFADVRHLDDENADEDNIEEDDDEEDGEEEEEEEEDETIPEGDAPSGTKGPKSNDSFEDLPLKKLVYMCKYCDVAFALPDACSAHENQDHDSREPYACSFCQLKTANRTSLIVHIRDVHGITRPYICIQCQKGFHRRSDLKKHTFVHTGVRPYACQVCGKSFSRNTNLTKHLRIHSGFKPHACDACPRSFANKADLVRHQNVHLDVAKQFFCVKCNNTYARKDKLISHERLCYGKEPTVPSLLTLPAPPEYDGENMVIALDPYPEIEPPHILEEDVGGIMPLAPLAAIPGFANMSLALPTVPMEPRVLPRRNFECLVCGKRFGRKRERDRHLAVHSDYKPFACDVCPKKFSRKDKLLRHVRIHRDDKYYACINCDAKFLKQDALAIHSKIHCTATVRDESEVIIMIDEAREEQIIRQVLSYAMESADAITM